MDGDGLEDPLVGGCGYTQVHGLYFGDERQRNTPQTVLEPFDLSMLPDRGNGNGQQHRLAIPIIRGGGLDGRELPSATS